MKDLVTDLLGKVVSCYSRYDSDGWIHWYSGILRAVHLKDGWRLMGMIELIADSSWRQCKKGDLVSFGDPGEEVRWSLTDHPFHIAELLKERDGG